MEQKFRVTKDKEGERIDAYLASKTSISRSSLQHLIKDGSIRVNNEKVRSSYRVKTNDSIRVIFPEKEAPLLDREAVSTDIVYRDENLIVVNKPPGIVMYPAPGHPGGTLMNAIAYHVDRLATIGAPLRPGVVHRIDKDTSGLIVVALTDEAYFDLVRQFKDRSIERRYIALIYGQLKENRGEIELPIGRSLTHRKKMSTRVRRGKPAKTLWRVIKRYRDASMVEVRLATGRTHQIRVHFSALGHPVLGDKTYGRKTSIRMDNTLLKIPRQMLHAESLGIEHPISGERLEFHAPLPEDMKETLEHLK